jgi:hypothetical protein
MRGLYNIIVTNLKVIFMISYYYLESKTILEDSARPTPIPTPIQLTPSPIIPADNHRIDVEDDGSLKLSILIKESLKRTKPAPHRSTKAPRKPSPKPKFASFPTRIPHTLGPSNTRNDTCKYTFTNYPKIDTPPKYKKAQRYADLTRKVPRRNKDGGWSNFKRSCGRSGETSYST